MQEGYVCPKPQTKAQFKPWVCPYTFHLSVRRQRRTHSLWNRSLKCNSINLSDLTHDVKCNLKTSVFSCCLPHIHVGTGKVQEIKVPPQHMRRWINQRCMWVWAKSTVIIAPGRRQTNIKMKEKRYKFIQNKINITVELHLRGTALYMNTNNQVSTRNVCVRTSRDINWLNVPLP